MALNVVDVGVQLGFLVAALRGALSLERYLVDEAFVALRVADNVLRGHGWVFNVGEHVNASAAPLHVVVLMLLRLCGLHGPQSLLIAFGLGLGATAVILYRMFRVEGRVLALFVVAVMTVNVLLVWSAGMEIPLFLASVAAAAASYQARRSDALGVSIACAALLRPEGLALFVLIPLVSYVSARTLPWRSLLVGGMLCLPWLVFARGYFGALAPGVMTAARSALTDAWRPSWIHGLLQEQTMPYVTIPLAVAGLTGSYLCFPGVRRFLIVWCSFVFVQIVAYAVLDPSVASPWHLVPGTLTINLLLVLLLFTLSRWMASSARAGAARWALSVAGVLLKLVGTLTVARLIVLPFLFVFPDPSIAAHRAVGEWLAANTARDAVIVAGDVGYVGYVSGRTVIDIETTTANRPGWWMQEPLPDVIVMHDPPWPNEPSKTWPAELYGQFTASYRIVFSAWSLVVFRRT